MKKLFWASVLSSVSACAFAQIAIVNGASFASSQPIAPGSFASVFGQNLCPQTAVGGWIAPGQLPSTLGGCSVAVNGMPAMLQYVSPGQMNFIVPQTGAGNAAVVVNNGAQVMSGSMAIGAGGPGVFTMNGLGMGQGAMLHGTMWTSGAFSTTTNGQTTPVAIFCTGLDLSATPAVSVGGVPATVTFSGNAPGYVGLQQININMPPGAAGAGRVPVTVTSGGQTSNVTFMTVLPTMAMMQGMPGGMMVGENTPRGHEVSYMALNPANNTALVADENDDAVRVISLDSQATAATITLPQGSGAHAVAVNGDGTLAAVVLSAKASVALVDLRSNSVVSVIGTGYYPSRAVFSGANLLVTNEGSGSVSVIDTASRTVTQTVPVGFGPSGIAANGNVAVVTDMQAGALTVLDLTNYAAASVPLTAGTRPRDVAIAGGKAVITAPMANAFFLFDLASHALTPVPAGAANAMGPGAITASGATAYVANQMTATVTAIDATSGAILKTFAVDPGPVSLAVNPAKNQLVVLAEGTSTLDIVDLGSYNVVSRMNAAGTERQGTWVLPVISSLSPNSAAAGSTFTLTIKGSGLQTVQGIAFSGSAMGAGGGMMGGGTVGGGMMGGGLAATDPNINVSNVQVSPDGTEVTATVQILPAAQAGTRQLRLQTARGEVMGMMSGTLFTVTK